MYLELAKAFELEIGLVHKSLKLLLIIAFAPSFITIIHVLMVLTYINKYANILIRYSLVSIGYVYREKSGIEKIIYLPLLLLSLLPLMFVLYILVLVVRLVLGILIFLYNIHFIIITLPNKEEVHNEIEEIIKAFQQYDEI